MSTQTFTPAQPMFAFPQSLTEKYRPRTIDEFCGLPKAKAICRKMIATPFPSNWLFVGPSGTGKTSIVMATAELMPAELHHIPSQDLNLETIERVRRTCQYVPQQGKRFHVVLIDEVDQGSRAAQMSMLSKLDGTNPAPNTIWFATCNSTENLEDRFLSRFHVIEFSSYGIAGEVAALLSRVWDAETGCNPNKPNFQRITKEACNNVRGALMALETEILCAE